MKILKVNLKNSSLNACLHISKNSLIILNLLMYFIWKIKFINQTKGATDYNTNSKNLVVKRIKT